MTGIPLEILVLLIQARRLIAARRWHQAYILMDQIDANLPPKTRANIPPTAPYGQRAGNDAGQQ